MLESRAECWLEYVKLVSCDYLKAASYLNVFDLISPWLVLLLNWLTYLGYDYCCVLI